MAAKKKPATAAPKKASVKKKTTSGKASAKRPRTSGHVLSASDVSVLEALPSAYDVGPTERLADVLQNARNAHAAFTAYAKPLVAGALPSVYKAEMELAAKLMDWNAKWHPHGKGKKNGSVVEGLGLALHTWGGAANSSNCLLKIYPDGGVETTCGTRLPVEMRGKHRVAREVGMQNLDRNRAVQQKMPTPVHEPRRPTGDQSFNFVLASAQ